jgi:hypothetical protein
MIGTLLEDAGVDRIHDRMVTPTGQPATDLTQ